MRAGDLNDRVTIRREQRWLGLWGQETSWRDCGTTWASVTPSQGGEQASDKGVDSSVAYTVRLRYRRDLTSKDRFCWRGRLLDITSVIDPTSRRQELVCECVMHGDGKQAA